MVQTLSWFQNFDYLTHANTTWKDFSLSVHSFEIFHPVSRWNNETSHSSEYVVRIDGLVHDWLSLTWLSSKRWPSWDKTENTSVLFAVCLGSWMVMKAKSGWTILIDSPSSSVTPCVSDSIESNMLKSKRNLSVRGRHGASLSTTTVRLSHLKSRLPYWDQVLFTTKT